MNKISAKDNPVIKLIQRLNKSPKARREEALFIIEGARLCKDALSSGAELEFCAFSSDFAKKNQELSALLCESSEKSYELTPQLFKYTAQTEHPQGVLCAVRILDKNENFDTIKTNVKTIALERIQDPSNMGTILRTAEAFAVPNVVLSSDCCDIYNPKVLRGSMGAVFRQSIQITDDLPAFITEYNKTGRSYAAMLAKGALKLSDVSFSEYSLVVIGNEGSGISAQTADRCTEKIIIPMNGSAESLNASVAASIIMWEMVK